MMNKLTHLSAAACCLALAACGGGSDEDEKIPSPYAGAQAVHKVFDGDTLISSQTDTYLEVSRHGALSLNALPASEGTQIYYPVNLALPLPTAEGSQLQTQSTPTTEQEVLNQASAAFQATWQALQNHYGATITPEQLLEIIQDFDADLHTLYADYIASGLGLAEYIQFYEAIDRHFAGELDELMMRQFLTTQRMTAAQFLQQLEMAGWSANSFFAHMKAQGATFAQLHTYYEALIHPSSKQTVNTQSSTQAARDPGDLSDYLMQLKPRLCSEAPPDCRSMIDKVLDINPWALPTSITKIFSQFLDDISTYFKGIVVGSYQVKDFSWRPAEATELWGGNDISTNKLTYEGTFLGATTYKFSVQLKATVNAQHKRSYSNGWVKSVSLSVTDKKARTGHSWYVGGFQPFELSTPSNSQQHALLLIGGFSIKRPAGYRYESLASTLVGHRVREPHGFDLQALNYR